MTAPLDQAPIARVPVGAVLVRPSLYSVFKCDFSYENSKVAQTFYNH